MNQMPPNRILRRVWLAAWVIFVAVWVFPVSNRMTRVSGLVLLAVVWFGLIALYWNRRVLRISLLGLTVLAVGFLLLPARRLPDTAVLRSNYVAGMQRYESVPYYWGGESPKGIDCSGLIRRGLIDSLFLQGLRALDAGLVRRAFSLWWHDTTARALGQQHGGETIHVLDTPSINTLDHTKVLAGDLAVTRDGMHIMAYTDGKVWIEADPGAGRVICVTAPSSDNIWFQSPMRIVRWRILQP